MASFYSVNENELLNIRKRLDLKRNDTNRNSAITISIWNTHLRSPEKILNIPLQLLVSICNYKHYPIINFINCGRKDRIPSNNRAWEDIIIEPKHLAVTLLNHHSFRSISSTCKMAPNKIYDWLSGDIKQLTLAKLLDICNIYKINPGDIIQDTNYPIPLLQGYSPAERELLRDVGGKAVDVQDNVSKTTHKEESKHKYPAITNISQTAKASNHSSITQSIEHHRNEGNTYTAYENMLKLYEQSQEKLQLLSKQNDELNKQLIELIKKIAEPPKYIKDIYSLSAAEEFNKG